MVAAVRGPKEVALTPRRVSFGQVESWIAKHLKPSDEVVLEATTNAWHVHDQVAPLVSRVVVAHPYQVKLITVSTTGVKLP